MIFQLGGGFGKVWIAGQDPERTTGGRRRATAHGWPLGRPKQNLLGIREVAQGPAEPESWRARHESTSQWQIVASMNGKGSL